MGALFYLAASGFVAALIVHLLTILGVNYFAENNATFVLHFLIFIPFIGMLIHSRKGALTSDKKAYYKDLLKGIPKAMRALAIGVFIYAGINFMYSITLLSEGAPVIQDGNLVLLDHGRYVRELSEAEFFALKRAGVRAFSGHWLVFFLIPALYFRYVNHGIKA